MTEVSEQTGAWLELFTNQLPAPAWLQPLKRDHAPRVLLYSRFVEVTKVEDCFRGPFCRDNIVLAIGRLPYKRQG